MKYMLVLSRENLELAKEEVLALVKTTGYKLIENLLLIEIEPKGTIKKLSKRLAYTNSIYSLLFECDYQDFLKSMEGFDWDSVYKDNFCIRCNVVSPITKIPLKNKKAANKNSILQGTINNKTNKKNKTITKNTIKTNLILNKNNKKINDDLCSEKNLAYYVWEKVKKPKVKLEDSRTHIEVFFTKDKAYCCLLLKKLEHRFEERKSHLRPRPSPISLHPKLARAMVNLTGAGENDVVLDPFCGSGGILIESGLMGMKVVGYDINKKMVWKSMVNLKHYRIKDYKLGVKDFFNLNKKYNYIAADLPYGLNTNIMNNIRVTKSNRKELKQYLEKFYSMVVKQLEKILVERAVIIFPNYVGYKKMIKNSKLKLIKEFESYVHGNLTRKIVVLEK